MQKREELDLMKIRGQEQNVRTGLGKGTRTLRVRGCAQAKEKGTRGDRRLKQLDKKTGSELGDHIPLREFIGREGTPERKRKNIRTPRVRDGEKKKKLCLVWGKYKNNFKKGSEKGMDVLIERRQTAQLVWTARRKHVKRRVFKARESKEEKGNCVSGCQSPTENGESVRRQKKLLGKGRSTDDKRNKRAGNRKGSFRLIGGEGNRVAVRRLQTRDGDQGLAHRGRRKRPNVDQGREAPCRKEVTRGGGGQK